MATNEKQFVFTSKLVEDVTNKINDGYIVKRHQNPWFKGEVGVRRAGIAFRMSEEEIEEYIKCKVDIHYFANNYCKIKLEDGSVGQMRLRDYQRDILDLYTDNRFSILMASRQVGKCMELNTNVLCQVTSSDGSTKEFEVPFYKLLFKYKANKTIYDYLKYPLYRLINILSK